MVNSELSRRSFLAKGAATGGIVALGVGAGSALAVCSSGSSSSSTTAASSGTPGVSTATPVKGGTAIIGITAESDGFLPATNHWDANGILYANTVYDPLAAVARDGSIQPYLAESITPNATYTQWTVTLRSGVTFHDGSPLTAQVVVNNFEAIRSSPLTGTALSAVSSAEVTGPLTLVFNCPKPYVPLPAALTTQVGYVVAQSMLDAAAANPNAAPTPVGTGPFVYSVWEPNDHFTATRNPNYWRSGFPYLDSITYKPIPDTSQAEATLRTGGVDLIVSRYAETVNDFKGDSNYQVFDSLMVKTGEPDMDFIMLNGLSAPTNDLNVRRALAMAIDQTVVQKLFGGGLTQPANGVFPPTSKYYTDTGFPTYNPSEATKLINAYKAQHGPVSIALTTITSPIVAKVAQVVQQMWQQVGVTTTIKPIEESEFIDILVTGGYEAAISEQFSAPDPSINYVWWSTTTVKPNGQIALNFARNSDPQIEQALLTGRSSSDEAAVVAAYQEVDKRLGADIPYIWLGQTVWSAIGNLTIQNYANPTLPDGTPQLQFDNGDFVPTQIWMKP